MRPYASNCIRDIFYIGFVYVYKRDRKKMLCSSLADQQLSTNKKKPFAIKYLFAYKEQVFNERYEWYNILFGCTRAIIT